VNFESQTQRDCFERVRRWADEMYDVEDVELSLPSIRVIEGSAAVYISIIPFRDGDAWVELSALVIRGVDLTQSLLQFLLRENHGMRFAALSLDAKDDVWLKRYLQGSTLDKVEFTDALIEIALSADKLDGVIKERWGGR